MQNKCLQLNVTTNNKMKSYFFISLSQMCEYEMICRKHQEIDQNSKMNNSKNRQWGIFDLKLYKAVCLLRWHFVNKALSRVFFTEAYEWNPKYSLSSYLLRFWGLR